MKKLDILIFLRGIWKQKTINVINLTGLIIGFTCSILIFLWIRYEYSFDSFHKNADNIYWVVRKYENPDGSVNFSPVTVMPLAKELKSSFPEIVDAARLNDAFGELPVKHNDNTLFAKGAPADKEFFQIFDLPFIYGSPASALTNNNSVVITESLSNKLFGTSNSIGQALDFELWGQWRNFEVTGVIKDIPANSNFDFEMVFPVNFLISCGWNENNWLNGCVKTFILTTPGTDMDKLTRKISSVNMAHHPKANALLSLQPLKKIHLNNLEGGGRIVYIYLFATVAIVILLISCINYINLTTAYAEKRMKEIGVKRVLGALRIQLGKQFVQESLYFMLISMTIAVLLVKLCTPLANKLLGSEIKFQFFDPSIFIFGAIALFVGALVGIGPSTTLSSFKFLATPTGKGSPKGIRPSASRQALVVLQFVISIALIIGAIAVHKQLSYIRNKDLGYNREQIIKVDLRSALKNPKEQETIKQLLLTNPDIMSATACNSNFTNWQFTANENDISWEGKGVNDKIEMEVNSVDYDYLNTFGMKMDEGRFFSKEFGADESNAVILNQSAVKALGLKNPIGKQFNYNGQRRIIGVVKDFNFISLHEGINPLVILINPKQFHSLYIKVRGNDMAGTLAFIEKSIEKEIPGYPFSYCFLDESINNLYKTEQYASNIMSVFSLLAILISCLGMLGLIAYVSERRTKEIGIRKVNGAKISEVLALLNKDFVKWVVIAFVIATPIAWYAMHKWLENFAYKTTLSWWIFALAGLLALGIALLTVSWQSWRAATRNPVEALRYE
jgi:putative ABC transport system permease protein